MHVFFINLDRDTERRRFIEKEMAAAGIEAERISGVVGADVPPHLKSYFVAHAPGASGLRDAEIGCYASHLKAMQCIVERGIDAALVVEDDARLTTDLRPLIVDLLRRLPAGWDLVRLCRAPKRAVRPLATLTGGRSLVRYSRVPVGAAGYLVSNAGARKLLRPHKVWRPIDVDIAHPWEFDLDAYGVVPPPITQERKALVSTIGTARSNIARIHRALPDPRRLIFNLRKLGPWWWLRCWSRNLMRHIGAAVT